MAEYGVLTVLLGMGSFIIYLGVSAYRESLRYLEQDLEER